ncbi:MAG: glycosyltransferase family 2 protein [Prevotellaceae bacterium]|jgi:GT2 family glycosyltransferase|nr:glycosyltransferase family 2 protein [Prevotellaceae bacterium]
MIKTSVVILNWNGIIFLEKFLPSVIEHSIDGETEVVVADNGSSDNSIAFIEQNFPQVRVIPFCENYGFTGGYNRALNQISAKYAVLLNSDVEVKTGWLKPLIAEMESNEQIGACMPKIISQSQPQYFEYAGAAGGFMDVLGYPFCRGRILQAVEKDEGQYNDTCNIFWATGACMVVRTELYKKLGGLDDDFFAHMEEIDLCWRMQNNGYKIVCVGNTQVYHVGGGTLPNNSPRKLFLNYRNNLLILYKNLPKGWYHQILILRFFLDWASAVAFALQLKFSFAKSVFKAHRAFFKICKGKRGKNNKKLRELSGVYHGSIIISYLIKGRKIFSRLKISAN